MLDEAALYVETLRVFAALEVPVDESRACLFWAMAAVLAAKNLSLEDSGYEFQLQAGSASWIRLAPEDDDGKETTHNAFSYVFEDSPLTRLKILMDEMPEMHCWVACAKTQTIFDPTTRFLPQQCEQTGGMPWTAPKPPDFMVIKAGVMQEAFYTPSMEATHLAYSFLQNFIRSRQ